AVDRAGRDAGDVAVGGARDVVAEAGHAHVVATVEHDLRIDRRDRVGQLDVVVVQIDVQAGRPGRAVDHADGLGHRGFRLHVRVAAYALAHLASGLHVDGRCALCRATILRFGRADLCVL